MKFSKKKLSNGLRYILIPMKYTESVLSMVLVNTGADFESKEENGLAHFLEHMCFKGTKKRPSAKDISLELDMIGADYNAFTSRGYTGYYARAHKKHGEKILEMISDIFLNSTFPNEEIQKEQGVVIQEINMYADDPQQCAARVSNTLLYGDQPAGREIIGTKETVASFNREHLVEYHKKYYQAKNTLVVIAGNFKEAVVEKQINNLFKGMKAGKKSTAPKTIVRQEKPEIAIEYKKTDQTHLVLSFRSGGYFDKNQSTVQSLSVAFGGNMSSRLFQKMREELGICYYIGSTVQTKHDIGAFTIYAGVSNDRVEEALEGIVSEIKKLKKEGITADELKKVTECRLSGLVLNLETTEDYADLLGKQEILKNKVSTPVEIEKKIEGVTLKAVNRVIPEIFVKNKASLALVGPFKEEDKAKFLKILENI
jgi:predicted Zn-dependent peptidase